MLEYEQFKIELSGLEKSIKDLEASLDISGKNEKIAELEKEAAGNPDIVFAGRAERPQLRKYYAESRALIFPGIEDFGIVPLETQSLGIPVIALGAGGALETVISGQTGLYFPEPSIDSLCHAIEEFEAMKFDRQIIIDHARKFSRHVFVQKLRKELGMDG